MLEPISARLASSFSRNGIKLAATETSCLGLTSMYSISSRCLSTKLPAWRVLQRSGTMRPGSSSSDRNQAGRHRDELLGADVDVLDFVAVLEHEIARLAGVAEVGDDAAGLVELPIGLGDGVLVFLPGGEILAMRFELGRLFLSAQSGVGFFDVGAAHDVAHLVLRVAGIEDLDLIHDHAL